MYPKERKTEEILKKFGHTLSDEEMFSVAKNIQQLADVLTLFESKKNSRKMVKIKNN